MIRLGKYVFTMDQINFGVHFGPKHSFAFLILDPLICPTCSMRCSTYCWKWFFVDSWMKYYPSWTVLGSKYLVSSPCFSGRADQLLWLAIISSKSFVDDENFSSNDFLNWVLNIFMCIYFIHEHTVDLRGLRRKFPNLMGSWFRGRVGGAGGGDPWTPYIIYK